MSEDATAEVTTLNTTVYHEASVNSQATWEVSPVR